MAMTTNKTRTTIKTWIINDESSNENRKKNSSNVRSCRCSLPSFVFLFVNRWFGLHENQSQEEKKNCTDVWRGGYHPTLRIASTWRWRWYGTFSTSIPISCLNEFAQPPAWFQLKPVSKQPFKIKWSQRRSRAQHCSAQHTKKTINISKWRRWYVLHIVIFGTSSTLLSIDHLRRLWNKTIDFRVTVNSTNLNA